MELTAVVKYLGRGGAKLRIQVLGGRGKHESKNVLHK